jgi:multiple sugar transport system ATP-binding protein
VAPPDEIYERPANAFVAGFIGSPPMNMLTGTLHPTDDGLCLGLPGASVPLPAPLARAISARGIDEIVLGVRAEHLLLAPDGVVPAVVTVVESLGAERHIICRVTGDGEGAGQMVIARQLKDERPPAVGEAVRLSAPVEHLHAFDAASGARIEPE